MFSTNFKNSTKVWDCGEKENPLANQPETTHHTSWMQITYQPSSSNLNHARIIDIFSVVCLRSELVSHRCILGEPRTCIESESDETSLKNIGIREIMYTYTGMIRMFMCFRAVVCYWAAMELVDGRSKTIFCGIILAFDLYMMTMLVIKTSTHAKVMVHQNAIVPMSIQASLCIAGSLALALHFFNHIQ